jgi:hypothetical protein
MAHRRRRPQRNLLPLITEDRRRNHRHRRHPTLRIQELEQLLQGMQITILVFTTRKMIQDRESESILKRAGIIFFCD